MRFTENELLEIAVTAALKAGNEVIQIYNDKKIAVQYKADQSPVTRADLNASQIIDDFLYPTDIACLCEEGDFFPHANRKNHDYLWIIDPLDGTREFISRNGEFTINIGLSFQGYMQLGVVYAPVLDELYFGGSHTPSRKCHDTSAIRKSAHVHYKKLLECSQELPLSSPPTTYTVVSSRSHLDEATQQYIEEVKAKKGSIEIVTIGSSLKFCLVAEGKAHLYPRFVSLSEWDTAAGHAIVKFANGNVVDLESNSELIYNKDVTKSKPFLAFLLPK